MTKLAQDLVGWHSVRLARFAHNYHAIQVIDWCMDHVKGQWTHQGSKFVFENQKDAVWFTMNWL